MLLKRLIISIMLLDSFLSNFLKRYIVRTKWVLTGQCKKCGVCCQDICLRASKRQIESRFFRAITIWWVSWLFDFVFLRIETDPNSNYIVFTCKHLKADGRCGNYFWRSHICRNYPLVDYFDQPKFRPNCGFKAELR